MFFASSPAHMHCRRLSSSESLRSQHSNPSMDNIPGDPARVSPMASSPLCVTATDSINVTLPPNSFVNLQVPLLDF